MSLPKELKKCLDLCAVARVEIVSAQDGVARAEKALAQAKKRLNDELKKFESAFFKCGGVMVLIHDDGYRNMHGSIPANNLFVTKRAMLASGETQKISELKLPIDSSRARTLQRAYETFQVTNLKGVTEQAVVAVLASLVGKLCEVEVLSVENKFVAVDGRYFMKDYYGWVSILQRSLEEA